MKKSFVFAVLTAILSFLPLYAWAGRWGKCPASVRELVDRSDRLTRGDSSVGVMSMKVYKRGTVSIQMEMWSKGRDKFLARVRRPSRLRGTATLKSGDNLWNFLPRADRVVRLGTSMMGDSWMGSHFTNDDLVKETDVRKHYTCTSHKREGDYMLVEAAPRPDAPVVWGKVVFKIRVSDAMPIETKYYNERGKLDRTLSFHDVREMGGRKIPTRMVMQPAGRPSERTVVTYNKIRFNVKIPDRIFTLQGLQR